MTLSGVVYKQGPKQTLEKEPPALLCLFIVQMNKAVAAATVMDFVAYCFLMFVIFSALS